MLALTPERIRFIRFCVVGASGVIVNLLVFRLAYRLILADQSLSEDQLFTASNLAGFVVSVLTNFLLNDFWTWGDREKRGHAHFFSRLAKFYLVSSLAGAVQLGVAHLMRDYVPWPEVAVLIGIAVATVINFVANNLWTFGDGAEPLKR